MIMKLILSLWTHSIARNPRFFCVLEVYSSEFDEINKQGDVAVLSELNFIYLIFHGCPLVEL